MCNRMSVHIPGHCPPVPFEFWGESRMAKAIREFQRAAEVRRRYPSNFMPWRTPGNATKGRQP